MTSWYPLNLQINCFFMSWKMKTCMPKKVPHICKIDWNMRQRWVKSQKTSSTICDGGKRHPPLHVLKDPYFITRNPRGNTSKSSKQKEKRPWTDASQTKNIEANDIMTAKGVSKTVVDAANSPCIKQRANKMYSNPKKTPITVGETAK